MLTWLRGKDWSWECHKLQYRIARLFCPDWPMIWHFDNIEIGGKRYAASVGAATLDEAKFTAFCALSYTLKELGRERPPDNFDVGAPEWDITPVAYANAWEILDLTTPSPSRKELLFLLADALGYIGSWQRDDEGRPVLDTQCLSSAEDICDLLAQFGAATPVDAHSARFWRIDLDTLAKLNDDLRPVQVSDIQNG